MLITVTKEQRPSFHIDLCLLSAALAFSKQSRLAVLLQSVAASARSLLVFACTQGWAATARIVLPAACMDLGSAAAVVAALEEQLSAATRQLQLSQGAVQAEQARLQEAMQSVSGPS